MMQNKIHAERKGDRPCDANCFAVKRSEEKSSQKQEVGPTPFELHHGGLASLLSGCLVVTRKLGARQLEPCCSLCPISIVAFNEAGRHGHPSNIRGSHRCLIT